MPHSYKEWRDDSNVASFKNVPYRLGLFLIAGIGLDFIIEKNYHLFYYFCQNSHFWLGLCCFQVQYPTNILRYFPVFYYFGENQKYPRDFTQKAIRQDPFAASPKALENISSKTTTIKVSAIQKTTKKRTTASTPPKFLPLER